MCIGYARRSAYLLYVRGNDGYGFATRGDKRPRYGLPGNRRIAEAPSGE